MSAPGPVQAPDGFDLLRTARRQAEALRNREPGTADLLGWLAERIVSLTAERDALAREVEQWRES